MPKKFYALNNQLKRSVQGLCGSSNNPNYFSCLCNLMYNKPLTMTSTQPANSINNCNKISGSGSARGNGGLNSYYYNCSACGGGCNNTEFNHNGYCVNGVYYVYPGSQSDCTITTAFKITCTNALFVQTSDTDGESAYDMMTKYVGWYFRLVSSSDSELNIGTTLPSSITNILGFSVENVIIKVDTGNSGGCFKTPEQYALCSNLTPKYPNNTYADTWACNDCNFQT